MATLAQLRLQDWYSFQMETNRYIRKHLLKKWRGVRQNHYVYFIFHQVPSTPLATSPADLHWLHHILVLAPG